MSNVLNVIATDRALATGFFETESKSPVNKIWNLILPKKDIDMRLNYGQIATIFDRAKVFSGVQFSFITVHSDDYTEEAQHAIRCDLRRLPLTDDCIINIPSKILWGK